MSAWGLGRSSVPSRDYGAKPDSKGLESFVGAVIQMIPADIVAGYVAISALAPSSTPLPQLIVAAVFLALTPLVVFVGYRNSPHRTRLDRPPVARSIIAATSFLVWVASIPLGPIQQVLGYPDWVRGLVLVVGTIVLSVLLPPPRAR